MTGIKTDPVGKVNQRLGSKSCICHCTMHQEKCTGKIMRLEHVLKNGESSTLIINLLKHLDAPTV
jgi:hypothetical protein